MVGSFRKDGKEAGHLLADRNPEKAIEMTAAMRDLALEEGRLHGWKKIEDFPPSLGQKLSEVSQTMGAMPGIGSVFCLSPAAMGVPCGRFLSRTPLHSVPLFLDSLPPAADTFL